MTSEISAKDTVFHEIFEYVEWKDFVSSKKSIILLGTMKFPELLKTFDFLLPRFSRKTFKYIFLLCSSSTIEPYIYKSEKKKLIQFCTKRTSYILLKTNIHNQRKTPKIKKREEVIASKKKIHI